MVIWNSASAYKSFATALNEGSPVCSKPKFQNLNHSLSPCSQHFVQTKYPQLTKCRKNYCGGGSGFGENISGEHRVPFASGFYPQLLSCALGFEDAVAPTRFCESQNRYRKWPKWIASNWPPSIFTPRGNDAKYYSNLDVTVFGSGICVCTEAARMP
jgi:hypothetical protein